MPDRNSPLPRRPPPARRTAAAAVLACLLAGAPDRPAAAQVSEEIIDATAGDWLVLPADGTPGCGLRLDRDVTIGGRAAVPAADCAARLPAIADVSAWYLEDGVRLLDPTRRPVMSFEEDETGLLSSPTVADPVHFLVPARPGLTHLPRPDAMAGEWRLAGSGGGDDCRLAFAAATAPDEAAPVTRGAACAASGFPAELTRWRLDVLTLMLEGDEDAMMLFDASGDGRFEADGGEWRLVQEGAGAAPSSGN